MTRNTFTGAVTAVGLAAVAVAGIAGTVAAGQAPEFQR